MGYSVLSCFVSSSGGFGWVSDRGLQALAKLSGAARILLRVI